MSEPTTEQVVEAIQTAQRWPFITRKAAEAIRDLYAPVLAERDEAEARESVALTALGEANVEVQRLRAQVQRVEALIESADHEAHGHDGEAFLSAVLTRQVRAALAGPDGGALR